MVSKVMISEMMGKQYQGTFSLSHNRSQKVSQVWPQLPLKLYLGRRPLDRLWNLVPEHHSTIHWTFQIFLILPCVNFKSYFVTISKVDSRAPFLYSLAKVGDLSLSISAVPNVHFRLLCQLYWWSPSTDC